MVDEPLENFFERLVTNEQERNIMSLIAKGYSPEKIIEYIIEKRGE